MQESITQLSTQVGHSVTSWAASAAKQTNLNVNVPQTSAPPTAHKTLHHALSRGAASGALELGASATDLAGVGSPTKSKGTGGVEESKLGEALQKFALAQDRVGNLRLTQDDAISGGFLNPWNAFGSQIALALKARQSVREARLHLDSWRQALKAAETAGKRDKVETMRADVEAAEDKVRGAMGEWATPLLTVPLRLAARERNRGGHHSDEESAGGPAANQEPVCVRQSVSWAHQDRACGQTDDVLPRSQAEFHKAANEVLEEVASTLASAAMSAESDYMSSR